jgi:biotin-[acetyl-CoA-carboxylase] ligase BirA-like protein
MLIKYHFSDHCDSTQLWAHDRLHELSPNIINKFSAIKQTHGQGTHGKTWLSPPGGYYTSFSWLTLNWLDSELSVDLANMISKALKQYGIDAYVKPPNDIFIDQKKVAGHLIEQEQVGQFVAVVIGIGINIDSTVSTTQPTTSLSQRANITMTDIDQSIDQIIWGLFLRSNHLVQC